MSDEVENREIAPTAVEKVADTAPEKISPATDVSDLVKRVSVTYGNRAIRERFYTKFLSGMEQIWGSRILLLLTVTVLCCIYVGADLLAFFSNHELVVEVDYEKIQFSLQSIQKNTEGVVSGPVKVPIRSGGGWASIIGHLILVILTLRCLTLVFRERNSYNLTQF